MMTIDDAAHIALGLPDVLERLRTGNRTWFVTGKGFAWERPFSKADLRRFGASEPPDGPILAISVADLGEKEAVLASNPAFFTIEHFAGYPAILVALKQVGRKALTDAIVDGWLACAPLTLAETYLGRQQRRD